VKTEAKT